MANRKFYQQAVMSWGTVRLVGSTVGRGEYIGPPARKVPRTIRMTIPSKRDK